MEANLLSLKWTALRREWVQLNFGSQLPHDPIVEYLVRDNLPRKSDAEREWKKAVREARTWLGKEGTPLDAPLTNDEQKRRRFRGSTREQLKSFGPRYGPAISLGVSLMPGKVAHELLEVFGELGCYASRTFEALQGQLRILSEYAKKFGELKWGESWKYFHGLDIQSGYLEAKKVEDFVEDIRDWSEVESEIAVPLDEFRLGVRDCLEQGKYNPDGLSLVEWAKEYTWARSGSSDGPRLELEVDGERKKARKSKNASALAMSPEDVIVRVLAWEPQKNKAIQKRELGKVRAVIGGDLNLYLRMSFIDQWLFDGMRGTTWSTLFYSPKQMSDLWDDLGNFFQPSVRVPLDQSKFDHQVSKPMVLAMAEEIKRLISDKVLGMYRDIMLEVMDRIVYSLQRGGTWVGKTFVEYKNGVMSGWKWTALFDSIANWAELFVARRWVERKRGGGDVIKRAVVQGDDSRIVVQSEADALALILAYEEMNITINPRKFFVSGNRDEYLRKVGEAGVTSGYFWRAIPSLFWRNPISKDPPIGELRAREQLNGWLTLIGRGGDMTRALSYAVKDIMKANHLNEGDVTEWMELAAAYGGAGLKMATAGLRILPSVRVPEGVSIVNARGLDYLSGRLGVDPSVLGKACLDRVELPPSARVKVEVPSRVEKVDLGWGKPRKGVNAAMVSPRWTETIPEWVRGAYIDIAIRDGREDELVNIMEMESRNFYTDLKARASRGVLRSWLQGKLPSGLPAIPGWSPAFISSISKDITRKAWEGALGLAKVRMTDLSRAAYWAEAKIRDFFTTYQGTRVAE